MPHDSKGNELKVSDIVSVPCKVKAIHLTEDYCNIDLETMIRLWPSDNPMALTLNSRQVVRGDSEARLLRAARPFLDFLLKQNMATSVDPTGMTRHLRRVIEEVDKALGEPAATGTGER